MASALLMAGFLGMRKFGFRGGPMHGRELEVPDIPENSGWWITTIDGVYIDEIGKISFEMLEDPNRRRDERYVRVGDQFVHETLVAPQDEPPHQAAEPSAPGPLETAR